MARDPLTHEIQEDDESEYGWGAGLFPPGVANNEGQRGRQDDFGEPYASQGLSADGQTHVDNYARAVADRRTDPTDPESGRDFEVAGLEDRYGANPPLVQAKRQRNVNQRQEIEPAKAQRRW
jgi:hypothetical protein